LAALGQKSDVAMQSSVSAIAAFTSEGVVEGRKHKGGGWQRAMQSLRVSFIPVLGICQNKKNIWPEPAGGHFKVTIARAAFFRSFPTCLTCN